MIGTELGVCSDPVPWVIPTAAIASVTASSVQGPIASATHSSFGLTPIGMILEGDGRSDLLPKWRTLRLGA